MSNSKILIDSGNIRAIIDYVESLKTLKKVVRDDFNKESRKQMVVADIISKIPAEVEMYEKAIREYFQRNANVVKVGQAYLKKTEVENHRHEMKFMKILSRDNKWFSVEELELFKSGNGSYKSIKHVDSQKHLVRELVNDYYNDILVEISEEEFQRMCSMFKNGEDNINKVYEDYAD